MTGKIIARLKILKKRRRNLSQNLGDLICNKIYYYHHHCCCYSYEPCADSASDRNEYKGYTTILGGKGGQCVRPITLPPSRPTA